MKIFRSKILILYFLFIISPAFSNVYDYPVELKNVLSDLPKMSSIKCNFRQEKYMQNISKPIISSGNFEFVEKKGVYFHTTYPIKSDVDYTNKNYKQINSIISAIATKKYSRIEKNFEFFYQKDNKCWELGMKPKKSSEAYNYIKYITLVGDDYIKKITISQTNGNKMILWFMQK